MITYPLDITKPYQVLSYDGTYVQVQGCSKVVQITDGEFGGVRGTWTVHKDKLLTKEDKRQLGFIRSTQGTCARQELKQKLLHDIIAEHSIILSV